MDNKKLVQIRDDGMKVLAKMRLHTTGDRAMLDAEYAEQKVWNLITEAYVAGEEETLNIIEHEQQKLLDGFGHLKKDCDICNVNIETKRVLIHGLAKKGVELDGTETVSELEQLFELNK